MPNPTPQVQSELGKTVGLHSSEVILLPCQFDTTEIRAQSNSIAL